MVAGMRRRLTILAALAAALAASEAAAEPHGLAAAFGNTVKALYPDGRYQWLWIDADGGWEAIGRRGLWSSGRWSRQADDKVCLRQSKPFPVPFFRYCTRFPRDGGIGAVWASHDMHGEPIEVTLVPGIQRPPDARAAAR
jgi:hypothetical protein